MSARVLLIGGTDSSAGAGLARDLATAAQMGATPCLAVTAVTAQTDAALTALHPVPPKVVAAQIRAAGAVGAVKIGMLATAPIVEAVAAALPPAPVVLDPVLAASSGRALLDAPGQAALVARLLPRATLLTPNLPELRLLARHLGLPDEAEESTCAAALLARGCGAVLIKGGHAPAGPWCEDRLYRPGAAPALFGGPRFEGTLRGTGCQLASAIAAALALGASLSAAIITARAAVAERFLHQRPESLPSREGWPVQS